MRKLILVLAALLLLLPGSAFAEPQEQLILRQIDVGSFDVWQHTDGRWQDNDLDGRRDPYGLTGKTLIQQYTLPQTQYTGGFTVTRVEIEYPFTLTDEELAKAGRSEDWELFDKKYLRKKPNNYKAVKTGENLAQGTVTVQRTFDLTPKLLNLKDPFVREELGMTGRDFSDFAQGWRWYIPVLINWYGVPKEQKNLKVKITSIPSEYPNPGAYVKISGVLINESSSPITTVVRWSINGNTAFEGQVTVEDTRDLNFTFQMPDSDAVVAVEANPNRDMPPDEITFEDNKDSVTIKKNVLQPVLNDSLRLTARSVGGTDIYGNYVPSEQRPPGTAKFTDIVRAELTARGAPDLDPCYRLITWELDSATIEYPKRHPDFTFGSPVEPQGTVKKEMQITGARSAVVEFREDWSLNGAQIFNTLKGEMVPGPTYYDVKVTYTRLMRNFWSTAPV